MTAEGLRRPTWSRKARSARRVAGALSVRTGLPAGVHRWD